MASKTVAIYRNAPMQEQECMPYFQSMHNIWGLNAEMIKEYN